MNVGIVKSLRIDRCIVRCRSKQGCRHHRRRAVLIWPSGRVAAGGIQLSRVFPLNGQEFRVVPGQSALCGAPNPSANPGDRGPGANLIGASS